MSDNLYKRQLRNIDLARGWIDHYAIDELYEMDSITSHAVKKLLIAGSRSGGKSEKQDLIEARNQLNRAIDDIELAEELADSCPPPVYCDDADQDSDQSILVSVTAQTLYDHGLIPEGATHYSPSLARFYKQNHKVFSYFDGVWMSCHGVHPSDLITIDEMETTELAEQSGVESDGDTELLRSEIRKRRARIQKKG